MAADTLLSATPLLDLEHPSLQNLIAARQWSALGTAERAGAAYEFVHNEIAFGYNRDDAITASEVLANGYGQCNTKSTLLMALLRALMVPCRLRGFTIDKSLQRGVVPELVYAIAPNRILHSWVEALIDDEWVILEGFILDEPYLSALQQAFPDEESLCAYGVGSDRFRRPNVEWSGKNTFIQATGIAEELGLWDDPDAFYVQHRQRFSFVNRQLYRFFVRHWMNRRVSSIRQGTVPAIPGFGKSQSASLSENSVKVS